MQHSGTEDAGSAKGKVSDEAVRGRGCAGVPGVQHSGTEDAGSAKGKVSDEAVREAAEMRSRGDSRYK